MSIAEILSHPLSLLLIGALVSGLLIPYFANRWQIHQKGLDIRINLVGRISQTLMGMITMIESMLDRIPKLEELNEEYRKFRVDNAAIWAELESYFPNQEIGKKWLKLVNDIEDWLELVKKIEPFYARAKDDFVMAKSDGDIGKTDNILEKKKILHKKYVIMQLVLNRPIPRFSLRPSIIGLARSKADARKSNHYCKQISSVHGDENDIEPLDRLTSNILDVYSKGELNEEHYESLSNKISELYKKIFIKKISSLLNNVKNLSNEKTTEEVVKIRNEVKDAYSEGKLNEDHYDLLNKEISNLKVKIM